MADNERVPSYSWYALAVLTLVYLFNFLDRTIIYILFLPIQKELSLSDLQLALLGSTSFVIFYTALGIPFGALADRVSRTKLIAFGLAVWSLFSGLTGFANGFWPMFLCRVMVGVGEATLGPAALSLLSDYFPPRVRAMVQSIYSTGIVIGGGLAFLLGGWIAQSIGWRQAFFIVGFPGLLLAAIAFALREPERGRTEGSAAMQKSADWREIFRMPALLLLFFGYAFYGLATNNLGIWATAFYARVHGISLRAIGTGGFLLSIFVGVPAMIFGGYVSDRIARRLPGGRMAFTACAAAISIPLWIAMLFSNSIWIIVAVNVVLYALAVMWVGPATADVHDLAGPHLRGLAIGIFFSMVNILAYGIGSPLIGRISDTLGVKMHPEVIRTALLACPAACTVSVVLLWLGSRAKAKAAR